MGSPARRVMIRKIFTLKNMLVILIIAGIIFIISGSSTYNEIEGLSYMMTGAAFIITGLYLMVRLKEKL